MSVMFARQLRDARRTVNRRGEAALWAQTAIDLLTIAPKEHGHVILHDLRLSFRGMAAKPGFASIAILSLALGIGANAAIFGLWNGVLYAPLPGVVDPGRLVILTKPSATGVWRGQWNPQTDGARTWVSYAEFEAIRDNVASFAGVMASQSSLHSWQARIDGGSPEELRGRLVSGGFFEVLGIRPAIGRLFTRAMDDSQTPHAVVSHSYWQRRFGGQATVLGKTIVVRDTAITIVGVAPASFIGETSGQSPDVWFPIRLQPRVLAGGDWLTERPPEKVMWLHLFGRLQAGASEAQAETQTNAVFQAFVKSTERLELRAAARGASPTRGQFSSSLTMLLTSSGILLLIACANLANLLLARSAARQGEIAVRVSLGASRGRIVRQLATEGMAIAVLGGLAAVFVAFALHGLLVGMLQASEPVFVMSLAFDGRLIAFAFGTTVLAALLVGLVPAWQMSRSDPTSYLKEHARGTIGSSRELRSARALVGLQIALSLPLLVAAGLLAQTVYNLQHLEFGFEPNGLHLARVELGDLTQDVSRRDRVLRELRSRFQRIPGVEAVTFSQVGLYTGSFSTAPIEVEGSAATAERLSESELDRLGTDYFTTLGVPLRLGRDITDTDRADSRLVCVINEAFVRRYFDGRHPIGLHVTTVEGDERRAYEVVGVAGDARTRSPRDEPEPRFFVPSEQRPSSGTNRTFIIRASRVSPTVAASVRAATGEVDAALSVSEIASIEKQMAPLTAEERGIARLAMVFGITALALAAFGIYGVLSYGVSRRSDEIAIRLALGAKVGGVVWMILRESLWLVLGGIAVGGVLAFYAPRIIASRLYGIAPEDPLTFVLATLALLLVAVGSAYWPARRASRVDPMIALHQG
jgi:predicted permease